MGRGLCRELFIPKSPTPRPNHLVCPPVGSALDFGLKLPICQVSLTIDTPDLCVVVWVCLSW